MTYYSLDDPNPIRAAVPESVREAIRATRDRYHRLLLVVGPPRSGKTQLLLALEDVSAPRVNVNLVLSESLLELTGKQRPIRAAERLGDSIERLGTEVVLLDNSELLFSPELALDPVRLFQSLARVRTIVAAWPGTFADGILTYAEPGHREFRKYASPDAVIVQASASYQESA